MLFYNTLPPKNINPEPKTMHLRDDRHESATFFGNFRQRRTRGIVG